MITQEEIYKLLQSEDWKSLIDIFHKRKDLIKSDLLLAQSLETTLTVITQKSLEFEDTPEFIENLESIFLLKAGKFISLKPEQEEAIIVAIVNGKKNNLSYSYKYAKKYPENELCKEIISRYEQEFPQIINHSQQQNLIATENKKIEVQNDFRKSLFNSLQEIEFYLALKRVFDTYQVYPNVGLSSILDYNNVQESLSVKEKDFFLKSSVDFVVFEPFRNYLPIYFFEIDSIWHDSPEQKVKDKMKNKIFSLCGQKLYRIRKVNNSIDENEFEKLIIEIRDKVK
jgi:hypothetical protein